MAEPASIQILEEIFQVILQRQREHPEGSYVSKLLIGGVDRIGKKVIEEAGETVIAAKNADPAEIAAEMADLLFHSLILLAATGVPPEAVWRVLTERRHTQLPRV